MPPLRRHVALLATLALAACTGRDGSPDDFRSLQLDLLAAPEAVTCAPGTGWSSAEQGGWEFRGLAEVGCWLDEGAPRELRFRFRTLPPTDRHAFRLSWDGAPLGDEPVWAGEELGLEVPADRLRPGRHHLTVERARLPGDSREPANRFETLAVRAGSGPERVLDPGDAGRLHRLADHLLHGATGAGELRTAGWLLAGPVSFEVELPAGQARRLRASPENLSGTPAILRIEVGQEVRSVALAPGERGRLDVPVPPGAARVRLAAEGAADGLLLFGAPRLGAAGEDARNRARPPIVLVTLDTTRRDALGAYGAPAGATPHLDRFAETATVYEDAVSTTSWTLPSHVSMFTGLYPSRHGLGVSRHRLPDEMPTLAGLLRERGYTPVGVAGGVVMAHGLGGARDFLVYRDPLDGRQTPGDRITDFALELLDETEGETPFLFVNYFDPHTPYEAPAGFQERAGVPEARAALRSPVWRRVATGHRPAWGRLVAGKAELTDAGLAWLRAVYRAEVAFMDQELGRLFAELERRGLWDDAVIAVVADHGELLGEGGYLTHGTRLDPELVEVPLLVKRPGQRRGRRVPGVVSVTDLFPTLLEAAGAAAPPGDGVRLGRAPASIDGSPRHALFEEHASRVHPLGRAHLRIAYHLWGYHGTGRRAVVWEGGAECRRRGGDGSWRPEPCPENGSRLLAALLDALGEPPAGAAEEAGELAEDRRADLEALGYL